MEPRPSNGMNQKATVRKLPKEKDAQIFWVLESRVYYFFVCLFISNFHPICFFLEKKERKAYYALGFPFSHPFWFAGWSFIS